ncbi:MAG: DUF1549 domain-containing protein [Planctomycetota bacterium]|nr:DUF1549 domain-containing protein [Planctomycetota bacterium]
MSNHPFSSTPLLLLSGLLLMVTISSIADDHVKSEQEAGKISFYREIRPILQANCHGCHQPAKAKGDYVMTKFDQLLAGGGEEVAIIPHQPDESLLVELITPIDGEAEMPSKGDPLKPEQIELIRRWIAGGAIDDTPPSAEQKYDGENPPIYESPPIVTALDYSPDGRFLAVSGFHEVLIHDVENSSLVQRLVGLSARIESVRFSPDGKRLAVTGGLPARMGEVQIWDTDRWELLLSVPVTFDTVYGASWSPDSRLIAFGCGDNTLRAIEAATGKEILFSGASSDWILDTVFSLDGSHVVSVGRDMTAKLTEVKTQRFIDNITSITPAILKGGLAAVDRHPTREEILVGGSDGTPQIYRIHREVKRVIGDNSNLLRSFPPLEGRIFGLGYRGDGKRIAAGSSLDGRGYVSIYASDFDGTLPMGMKGILEKVSTSRSAAERKKIEEFHARDIEQIAAVDFDTPIYSLGWHPQKNEIAVGGADGLVRFLDGESGALLRVLMSAPMTGAKSDDLVAMVVDPTSVEITEKFGYQQLIVTGIQASGHTIDLTHKATYESSDEILSVTGGMVKAHADGNTQLRIDFEGRSTEIPVSVSGSETVFEPSFIRDVSPVITRAGCNSGSCHGSKEGKNGFKLSLRGYDPLFDVRAFADDHAARRVNFASAETSLMLLKPTAAVPHEGGQRFAVDSPYYQIIRDWIAAGCELDHEVPRVRSIELFPTNPLVQKIGEQQQLRVTAFYDDGSSRDVTAEAFVTSGNTEIATCNDSALVSTLRRGEAPLLARYEGAYSSTTLTVMGDRSEFRWHEPEIFNPIDDLVADKWKRMKLLPSELCSDAEFLRRVSLDLTGLPPTADQVNRFLGDEMDQRTKRDALIDELIGSEEYVVHWGNRWADLLQVNGKFLGKEGAATFRQWIHDQVEENTPYDQFARSILTATGSTKENPPASYFKILRTPTDTMENTTQLFLATRFNCNKCHDHPFERWTQDQYYQLSAFFAQVNLAADPTGGDKKIGGTAVEGAKPLYEIISDKDSGEVVHDRTQAITPPQFPYETAHEVTDGASRREQLAAWMTSPDNHYFARSYVNRIWGYLTGVGLIDPLDDIRAGNPPSNPELLDYLTREFIDNDFDVRKLITEICKSRTYQLSIVANQWNQEDRINYSHATPRRLPAEVLYDSIHRVLGSNMKIPGVAEGTRASALPDVGIQLKDGFLATLGRATRESVCECDRSDDLGLDSIMALVTGPTVDQAISDSANAITKLVEQQPDDGKLIEQLYLRILNRQATRAEVEAILPMFKSIESDHLALKQEYELYQEEAKQIIAQLEDVRQVNIGEAKGEVAAYETEIAPREAELDRKQQEAIALALSEQEAYGKTIPEKLLQWEEEQDSSTRWTMLKPENLKASNGSKLELEDDGAVFASGKNGMGDYSFTASTDLEAVTAIRIEVLTDARLANGGPGRGNGNFVLSELQIDWIPAAIGDESPEPTRLALHNAKADFSQTNYGVGLSIDGKIDNTGWAIAPKMKENHNATYELKQPIGGTGSTLSFKLHQNYDANHVLGRFRVWASTSAVPVDLGLPLEIAEILDVEENQRSEEQSASILNYFTAIDPKFQEHKKIVSEAQKPRPVDPGLKKLHEKLSRVEVPVPEIPKLVRLNRAMQLSEQQMKNQRVTMVHDIAWALINSPAFLFNR